MALFTSAAYANVAVTYSLPYTAGQTKTYRVSLAITDPTNADWILSSFLPGAVRTVNDTNQGQFTDYWDGLDENRMPLPPGNYGVKGVYLPAEEWGIDGKYHSLTADYLTAAGDSWGPAKGDGHQRPHIFGFAFGRMADVQVGPNGRGSFVAPYIENALNPFLADFTQPIGWSQVVERYSSEGIGGGQTVASDGEYTFVVCHWDGTPSLYRAHDKNVWGPDEFGWGHCTGIVFPANSSIPSMTLWKRTGDNARFLYAAHVNGDNIGTLKVYNGNEQADTTPLAEAPAVTGLKAITLNRANPGTSLYALYQSGADWQVGQIALSNGLPTGNWTALFTVPAGIGTPADMDVDDAGRFYFVNEANHAVYQVSNTGTILHTYGNGAQTAGAYDPNKFMHPRKLAIWKDGSETRLLVMETSGPGRTSEWRVSGDYGRVRHWFFVQDTVQFGYASDPVSPNDLYMLATGSSTGKGVVRFTVNYDTGAWECTGVWPEIGGYNFPDGCALPKIINHQGQKYLAFGGTYQGNYTYMMYRMVGTNWVPSAGIITVSATEKFWWHDANGDGQVQVSEYQNNAAEFPSMGWWGSYIGPDLAWVSAHPSVQDPRGWPSGVSFKRLLPSSFDSYNNPVYQGTNWVETAIDTVLTARRNGTATLFNGGNELDPASYGYTDILGTAADGYYVIDTGGYNNPYDSALYDGLVNSQFKLSRYVPDGQGGYDMKWRVGRKVETLSKPGEVYRGTYLMGPLHGVIGVADLMGMVHFYTTDGLYLDTVMVDPWVSDKDLTGMYYQGQGSWQPAQLIDSGNKAYLMYNRTAMGIYEVKGLTAGAVQSVTGLPTSITLTPGATQSPSWYALQLRGGYGSTYVMKSTPVPAVPLPLNGPLTGWDTSASPLLLQADAERTVAVRMLNDADNLYVRMQVRVPETFIPQPLGDATQLFTSAAGHTTVSIYLRGDTAQASTSPDGEAGDVRLVFALVDDNGVTRPVCLGVYPDWPFGGTPNPKSYTGASGTVSFEHVGLMSAVDTGYRIDADGKGFIIGAKIPRANVLPSLTTLAGVMTLVNVDATFNGTTKTLWANTMLPAGATTTTDVAAAARFYPLTWGQGQFSIGLTPPTTGLYAWWKAESITGKTDGQPIAAWADSSGNNRTAAQSTTGVQPTYGTSTIAGWPAVRFDGVDDLLEYSPSSSVTSSTFTGYIYGQSLFGQDPASAYYGNYNRLLSAIDNSGGYDYQTGFSVGSQTGAPLDARVYADKVTGVRSLDTFGLGRMVFSPAGPAMGPDGAFPWRGDMSEVLIYDDQLGLKAADDLQDYLKAKYAYPPVGYNPPMTVPTYGLQFWFKADAITGVPDGTPLETWIDSSGNDLHATQGTALNRPTYVSNGLKGQPSVRFDGVNSWMGINYNIPNSEVTYVAVLRTRNADTHGVLLDSVEPLSPAAWAADKGFGLQDGHLSFHLYNHYVGSGQHYLVDPTFTNDNNFHMVAATFGGTGTRIYLDGQLNDVMTMGSSSDTWGNTTILGAGPQWGFLNADIGEVLVYNRGLSNAELTQLKLYLEDKFDGVSPNEAPVVTLTSPNEEALYLPGSTITLIADANDADGSVSKVEFYNGSTKLGESTTAPYTFEWLSVPEGNYSLTAKAYDNLNVTGDSPANSVRVMNVPVPIDGLRMWLKADAITGLNNGDPVGFWNDFGGDNNDATQSATPNKPTFVTNALNGKPLVRFDGLSDGTGDLLTFPNITDIRTVFWVLKEDSDAAGQALLLGGDSASYDFHRGNTKAFWLNNVTSPNITNGTTRVNRAVIDGTTTAVPTTMSLVTLRTTDNVKAQNFSMDRLFFEYKKWDGDVAEILVYNRPLSDTEIDNVEMYLNGKYDLYNQPPTVSITSPAEGTIYPAVPSTFTITADAADVDGTISQVEFYDGTTLLGTDTTSPYSYTWTNAPEAVYTLTAKAYDVEGETTVSDAVEVIVGNVPPAVTLVAPADNAFFASGANVPMTATASDADGTIAYVEFYQGTTLLGTDSSSPYAYTWTSPADGAYSLTAKAYDNDSRATVSSPVTINVGVPQTGMVLWLKADALTGLSNGDPVSTWTDISGQGHHATQATATYQPTYQTNVLNGQPVVRFSTHYLDVPTSVNFTRPGTYFLVFNRNTSVGASRALGGSNNWLLGAYYNNVNYWANGWLTGLAMTQNQFYRACIVETSDTSTMYVNGTAVETSAFTVPPGNLRIGSGILGDTDYHKGDIAEVIVYNRALLASELQGVESYLNAKYFQTNVPPTVSLTAPTEGQLFASGTDITLEATASDSDGIIERVEFYQGSTLLGTDSTSPYSYTWPNVSAGTYSLTAKAYDAAAAATTSTAVNIRVNTPPTTAITAPTNNQSFITGATIDITATAADSDGTVTKVEFYQGSTKLGEDTASPYSYSWPSVSNGNYSLTTKAYDDDDAVTTSTAVDITVSAPSVPTSGLALWVKADAITGLSNNDPVATWVDSSGNGNDLVQPSSAYRPLYVTNAVNGKPAVRFDGDIYGSADWLDFTTGLSTVRTVFWVLREDTNPAYGFMLGDASYYDFHRGSSYNLWYSGVTSSYITGGLTRMNMTAIDGTATAMPANAWTLMSLRTTGNVHASNFSFDREFYHERKWDGDLAELVIYDRALSDSEIANVEAYLNSKYGITNTPPTVSITAPTNGAEYDSGNNVTITASASDSDGSITKVEFYQGTTKLGEDTSSPYSYTWTSPADGNYSLTAKATDNQTATTTSTAVNIIVGDPPSVPTNGLSMWLKADAITGLSNNDPVATWEDSSASNNDAVQPSSAYRPLYVTNAVNGKPAVRFDGDIYGSADWLDFTTGLSTVRTVFWVLREDTNPAYGFLLGGDVSSYDFHRGGSRNLWYSGVTSSYITGGLTRLNGSAIDGTATPMPADAWSVVTLRTTGNVRASNFSFDREFYHERKWDGDLAEVIIYDRALTDQEILDVEAYLDSKYNL